MEGRSDREGSKTTGRVGTGGWRAQVTAGDVTDWERRGRETAGVV